MSEERPTTEERSEPAGEERRSGGEEHRGGGEERRGGGDRRGGGERRGGGRGGDRRGGGGRRRRPAELLKGVDKIDYKNIELLERFLETGGRLRSRRRTRTAARDQRKVTQAVKRARHVALLPFTAEHERSSRRGRRRD